MFLGISQNGKVGPVVDFFWYFHTYSVASNVSVWAIVWVMDSSPCMAGQLILFRIAYRSWVLL